MKVQLSLGKEEPLVMRLSFWFFRRENNGTISFGMRPYTTIGICEKKRKVTVLIIYSWFSLIILS